MGAPRAQTGSTLIVALLMLAILALLGVNAMNTSTISLRVVANAQSQRDAEAAAQDAIEQVISSKDPFAAPADATITVSRPSYGDALSVPVAAAECLDAQTAEGYSAVFNLAPEATVWEVVASVVDASTGARAEIHQGVEITMIQGSCPEP